MAKDARKALKWVTIAVYTAAVIVLALDIFNWRP